MARKILLVTFDQWRGDAIGCLGHPTLKTPALDALAAESVVFQRHFTASAPCGPSRATLLTGRYPFIHRSVRNGAPLDGRFTNIAKEARGLGVDPVLFGYTDTALDPRTTSPRDPALQSYEAVLAGFATGMGMFTESDITPWAAALLRAGYAVPDHQPDVVYAWGAQSPDAPFSREPATYAAEHSDTAFTADRVIDYIRVNRARDWLAHASFLRPHPPLIAPAPYNELYPRDAIPAPRRPLSRAAEVETHPFQRYWLDVVQADPDHFQTGFAANRRSDAERADAAAVYFGLISECDHHLGRILAALEETGQRDETLVVVTSDHGEMLGDRWMWGKGGYHDASNHVPLLIRNPRAPIARRVDAFTESVDLAPTLIAWLGGRPPAEWDGRDLARWLAGETPRWRTAAFWEYDFREIATGVAERAMGLTPDQCVLNVWRERDWKLVWFVAQPPLLFDLAADPDERVNLATRPEHAATLARLTGALLSHRMLHADRAMANVQVGGGGVARYEGPRS